MALPPVCVLLAGGQGTRLNALAWHRAKPAVPMAGIYRLIDFTLSNAANSGILRNGILTQYQPLALMDHIGDGFSWDMSGRVREIKILPPHEGANAKDWYLGTAHAVYMNLDFIMRGQEDEVLILSGDHIYHMDYRNMVDFHRKKQADLTIATLPVTREEASRFGIAVTDNSHRIIEFQEKPSNPKSLIGSMGVYIFNRAVLVEQLRSIMERGKTDIGGDLVPSMIQSHQVFAYPFKGYWRDVGTLESYWKSNMDVLRPDETGLDPMAWSIRTNLVMSGLFESGPANIGPGASVANSYISQGCKIDGSITNSILSPGVIVESGAQVEDSILFHNVLVGSGTHLRKVIADKSCRIGKNGQIGLDMHQIHPNKLYPNHLNTGITLLGRDASIPAECRIGRNCLISPGTSLTAWDDLIIPSGETV